MRNSFFSFQKIHQFSFKYLSLRFFIFLFFSIIDIHVKAQEISPKNCVKNHAYPCYIWNSGRNNIQIKLGSTHIALAQNAFVQILSSGKIAITKGVVLVTGHEKFHIDLPYATAYFSPHFSNKVIFNTTKDRSYITVIDGQINGVDSSLKDKFLLTKTYQNWFSSFSINGKSRMGFPRPVDIESLADLWSPFYNGDLKQFTKDFLDFKRSLKVTVEENSQRSMASIQMWQEDLDKKRAAAKLRQEKIKKEQARTRALFYRKTFEE